MEFWIQSSKDIQHFTTLKSFCICLSNPNTFQQGDLITIQVDVWLQLVLVGRALRSCLEKCVSVCVRVVGGGGGAEGSI